MMTDEQKREIEELLIAKIKTCAGGISNLSSTASDLQTSEAIKNLVETIGVIERDW